MMDVVWFLARILNSLIRFLRNGFTTTITLNYWNTALIFFILAGTLYFFVRGRFLKKYSQHKDEARVGSAYDRGAYFLEPQFTFDMLEERKEKVFLDSKSAIISALGVFGYMERNILNGICREVYVKDLSPGEDITYILGEENLCVVVSGKLSTYLNICNENLKPNAHQEAGKKFFLCSTEPGQATMSTLALAHVLSSEICKSNLECKEFSFKNYWDYLIKGFSEIKECSIVTYSVVETTLAVIPISKIKMISNAYPISAARIVQAQMEKFRRLTYKIISDYFHLQETIGDLDKTLSASLEADLSKRLNQSEIDYIVHQAQFTPKTPMPSLIFKENFNDRRTQFKAYIMSQDESHISLEKEDKNSNETNTSPTTMIASSKLSLDTSAISPDLNSQSRMNAIRKKLLSIMQSAICDVNFSNKKWSSLGGKIICCKSDEVQILTCESGKQLLNQGDTETGLYLVLSGTLEAKVSLGDSFGHSSASFPQKFDSKSLSDSDDSFNVISEFDSYWQSKMSYAYSGKQEQVQKTDGDGEGYSLYTVQPWQFVGYMAAITGVSSPLTITAKSDAVVAHLKRSTICNIIDQNQTVLLHFAKRLSPSLIPLITHIDMFARWKYFPAGEVLLKEGGISDGIYVVICGRLRSIAKDESGEIGGYQVITEYGRGESVGELEMVNSSKSCPFTLYAIRDTEVIFIPREFFNSLATERSLLMSQMVKIIASRRAEGINNELVPEITNFNFYGPPINPVGGPIKLNTFAVLPLHNSVPINDFASNLRDSLLSMGESVSCINQKTFLNSLGVYTFSKLYYQKYTHFFEMQEEKHRMVLYVADNNVKSFWSIQCIKRADCIFLVGNINNDPSISDYERLILKMKINVRKELVLLQYMRSCAPDVVTNWLRKRMWISAHHYVYMGASGIGPSDSDFMATMQSTDINEHRKTFKRYLNTGHEIMSYSGIRSDFSRLARRLLSKSVGVVLSGGGARGIAHVGILKAFEERGIPIDMIGGCSIGAFVGALYACENNMYRVYSRTKMFSSRMSSLWRRVTDLTYPYLSLFTGHEFNRGIWKCFKDILIEDCWLPFFCVTTNLTHSRLEVHQKGYLWKYVRASMTIAGYLPPICDKGNMLVDGGYINNIPCDIMRFLGAKVIIAIDVSSPDTNHPVDYGDTVSGWWLLLVRLIPTLRKRLAGKRGYIPSLTEVQSRLAYASNLRHVKNLKKSNLYTIIKPPVYNYAILDFHKFQELYNTGYNYAKTVIKQWEESGEIQKILGPSTHKQVPKPTSTQVRRSSI